MTLTRGEAHGTIPLMKRDHGRGGRILVAVVVAEVLVILAVVGYLRLRPAPSEGPPDDWRPALANLRVESAVSGPLAEAAPWLDRTWVTRATRDALRGEGSLAVPEEGAAQRRPGRRRYELHVELLLASAEASLLALSDDAQPLSVHLAATLRLRRVGAAGTWQEASASATRTQSTPLPGLAPALVEAAVAEAVTTALSNALVLDGAADKTLDELIADARAPSLERRVAALRALGERKDPGALPVVVEALRDERHDVVLAAVGALVALRDPRCVGPLVDSTRDRSMEYLSQVLYAVSSIGGPEAEAYLDTLSEGHQSGVIRERARQALRELRSRKTSQGVDGPAVGAPGAPAAALGRPARPGELP